MADNKKEVLLPCIRCNMVPGEKDKYCKGCGAPVQNRCCDEPGLLRKGCTQVNDRSAAYCASCGQPTMYQLYGLITPTHTGGNKPLLSKIIP